MYSKNGLFGQVKLENNIFKSENLFTLSICGWHKCNDLYRIERNKRASALFLYTVNGCGEMEIEGKRHLLPPGTVGYIPKSAVGHYNTPKGGKWEFFWVHPCGETVEQFLKPFSDASVSVSSDINRCASCIEELMKLCRQQNKQSSIAISMKLSELLHLSLLDYSREIHSEPNVAERAIHYFNSHLEDTITIQTVADTLFVSAAHLIRVFKKEYGITPYAYLLKMRLQYSKQLLRSGLSISETATIAGFCSSSHFICAFRKTFGITPSQYHNQK